MFSELTFFFDRLKSNGTALVATLASSFKSAFEKKWRLD